MTDKDLYLEPGLTQLAAMAREEPESLEYVSNFRVVHRRHGSVLWTDPIDVRNLDLDNTVLFSPGAVDVRPFKLLLLCKHVKACYLAFFQVYHMMGRVLYVAII